MNVCFHTVFILLFQINLPLLSETYKLTFEECSNLLEQWSGKNEVKLSKLFLTQYVEKECLYVKVILIYLSFE